MIESTFSDTVEDSQQRVHPAVLRVALLHGIFEAVLENRETIRIDGMKPLLTKSAIILMLTVDGVSDKGLDAILGHYEAN